MYIKHLGKMQLHLKLTDPTIHHKCHLLSHLFMYYIHIASNMDVDQAAPKEQSDQGS